MSYEAQVNAALTALGVRLERAEAREAELRERLTAAEAERDQSVARHREAMAFTAEVIRERDHAIDAAHACAERLAVLQDTLTAAHERITRLTMPYD